MNSPMVSFLMARPAPLMNMNDRTHWAVKAKRVKAWRTAVALQARRLGPVPDPALVQIVFDVADNRRRDPHNLAPTVKACIDGLVDAGWWPDDDAKHVYVLDPEIRVVGRKARPCVEIRAVEWSGCPFVDSNGYTAKANPAEPFLGVRPAGFSTEEGGSPT